MFAQAKCKLPISSQKQNIVAHTTHTQKHKNTKTQKKTLFPLILQTCFSSVPAICICNIQIANFSQKQESIAHVQKRWKSCFTFCLKTDLDAEELCLNWSTQFLAHALQGKYYTIVSY